MRIDYAIIMKISKCVERVEFVSKKILIITQNFYPEIGSAGNRMKNMYQLLVNNGFEVNVLTTEPSYPNRNLYKQDKFWDDESLNNNNDIHFIKVNTRKYSKKMINRLHYYIEITLRMIKYIFTDKKEYDHIIVSSPPIFLGLAGLLAKKKYKAKMILEIRDLWPDSLKGVGVFNWKWVLSIMQLFEKLLYKKADSIIVNSPSFSEHIIKSVNKNAEDIVYIPNGARSYELQPFKFNNEFSVIYTGNIGLAQDIEFLKDLTVELHKSNIPLSIIGYGVNKVTLEKFVEEQNLNSVTFYSPTTREECLTLNRQHSLGVLALNENEVFETVLPGKLIDYMTCSLPMVASVAGVSERLINDTNVGIVLKKREAKEVVQQIQYLKTNRALYEEMQKNSFNKVQEEFLWEKNIKTLIKLFDKD